MYDFVLQTGVVLSLGILIYLLARAVPRLSENKEVGHEPDQLDKLMSKIPLAKIDATLSSFFEKLLRKFKVVVMKVDNLINSYINKMKKSGPPGAPQAGSNQPPANPPSDNPQN